MLLVLLLIGGGVGASLVFVSEAARSLRGSPLFHIASTSPTTNPSRPQARPAGRSERRRPRDASAGRPASRHPAPRQPVRIPVPVRNGHSSGGLFHVSGLEAVLVAGLEIAGGVLLLGLLLRGVRAAALAPARPPRVRAV